MSEARVWVPRPDQEPVMAWLDGRKRGLLVAQTGAGKTVMACTWLERLLMGSFEVDKALVVAPKLVLDGWREQIARWQHLVHLEPERHELGFDLLDLTPSVGSDGKRGALQFKDKKATKERLLALPGRLHLCSWDAMPHVEEALGKAWPYGALVLDESSFVRDQGSARGRAARRAVHKSGKVTHVLLMTATPNANHDVAVFSQVDLVAPGLLGRTLTEFRETYCVPDSRNWQSGVVYSWKLAGGMRAQFENLVASVALSVPESLGIDVLPVEHWVDLPPAARQDYDDLQRDQVLDLPRVTAASEAVLYAKLRQVAGGGFVYDDNEVAHGMHDAKLAALQRVLAGLPEGKQAVIVYEWEEELARLKALLGKDFSDIRRKGAKDAFLAGKLRWLGLHPKSAGHGLDGLQAATNVVCWCSVPDDLELFSQTNGRLKRPGQSSPTVMAHMIIARATVEERIWTEVLPAKAARAQLLLDAVRAKDSETV